MSTPVVAQLKPEAAQLKTILTLNANSMFDEFVACNESASDDYIRFMMNVTPTQGCCTNDKMYLFYDVRVKANSTFAADFKDWVPKGTVFKVYSLNGNVAFTLFTHTM